MPDPRTDQQLFEEIISKSHDIRVAASRLYNRQSGASSDILIRLSRINYMANTMIEDCEEITRLTAEDV